MRYLSGSKSCSATLPYSGNDFVLHSIQPWNLGSPPREAQGLTRACIPGIPGPLPAPLLFCLLLGLLPAALLLLLALLLLVLHPTDLGRADLLSHHLKDCSDVKNDGVSFFNLYRCLLIPCSRLCEGCRHV